MQSWSRTGEWPSHRSTIVFLPHTAEFLPLRRERHWWSGESGAMLGVPFQSVKDRIFIASVSVILVKRAGEVTLMSVKTQTCFPAAACCASRLVTIIADHVGNERTW